MKFILCHRASFGLEWELSGAGTRYNRYSVRVNPSDIRPCDGNSKSIDLCDKLRQQCSIQKLSLVDSPRYGFDPPLRAFEPSLLAEPEPNNANKIAFELSKNQKVGWRGPVSLSVLKGPVTSALVELCGWETKLQLTFTDLRSNSGRLEEFNSSEMNLDDYSDCICQDEKFCTEEDEVWNYIERRDTLVTITVICDDLEKLGPVVTDKMQVTRRMLLEEIRSDVVIIPENGKEVKAHTAMLAAHSDVFSAMFQSDMKEAKTHSVEMADMSDEGVRGLLAFLYCWEEDEPNSKPLVAFEMLHAGHKYNIPVMEAAMKKLLLAKAEKWFDVEVAMKLFLLARNLPEDGHDLKMKAIQVMKINFGNFKKSPTYVALFKENPEAAMELCEYFVA